MDKLSQILKIIEKAAPESESAHARAFFIELAKWCKPKDRQTLLKEAAELPEDMKLWDGIAKILGKINTESPELIFGEGTVADHIKYSIKKFSKLAQKRAIMVRRIYTHMMYPQMERLYFKHSKISIKELAERLQKLWINFRKKNLVTLDIPDKILEIKFSTTDTKILLDTIKNIHHIITVTDSNTNLNDPSAIDIPAKFFRISDHVTRGRLTAFRISLDALEAMAFVHHGIQAKLTPLTNIELFPFHDFVHCSKCWRLVPKFQESERQDELGKKYTKKLRTFYCDIHSPIECDGHTLTEYHKAIKLPCNNKKEGITPATAQKTFEIMQHFPSVAPDDPAGLSAQVWYEARVSPLHLLDLSKYPRIVFALNWLWELCPNVLRYIQENGGDPDSPESVLNILDPFTQIEERSGKELRIKLHKLLAKNFGLYLQEIAMAETFLSEYNQQWDGRTHGGKRRGENRTKFFLN